MSRSLFQEVKTEAPYICSTGSSGRSVSQWRRLSTAARQVARLNNGLSNIVIKGRRRSPELAACQGVRRAIAHRLPTTTTQLTARQRSERHLLRLSPHHLSP